MNTLTPLPALRAVDAFPVEMDGQKMVCLTDPSDYVEGQFMLSVGAYVLAAGLDGVRDFPGLLAAFKEQTGMDAPEADAQSLVEQLDQAGFLDSPAFHALRDQMDRAFLDNPVRPAWLAGKSYPAGPDALRAYLDECFSRDGGPGPIQDAAPGSRPALRCLVAPHIDLERGAHAYAHAYRRLYEGERPDLVLVFGVAHAGSVTPFILTRKDFATPLGTVRTDQDTVSRLAAACSWDPFAAEGVHRTEHSIEFQALMLASLYEDPPPIVPILCGALTDDPSQEHLEEDALLAPFLEACREITTDTGRRVLTLAGADLAHVGRRFGDTVDITDRVQEVVSRADHISLALLARGDAAGFYAQVMRKGNPRHVCGMGAIYTAATAAGTPPPRLALLHYDYAPDPAGGMVSFAAMAAE